MRLLFRDPVCPKAYQVSDLNTERMGGTEATCLRVMRELAKRYQVSIIQRGRTEYYKDGLGIEYHPENTIQEIDPNVVITLRDGREFRVMSNTYPRARHYLWLHDVVGGAYQEALETSLQGHVTNVICVSQWHKQQVLTQLAGLYQTLRFHVIYNPIEDYCDKLPNVAINPNKLIYISSPHKGLDQVLEAFAYLRTEVPELELHVANPGYYADRANLPDGVVDLTKLGLSHFHLMGEVRTSLAMFYPQTCFEETFGLVYAESNGVGTPVLAHPLGAAQEVLNGRSQLLNCNDLSAISSAIRAWRSGGRPIVAANKAFRLPEVMKDWIKLIKFDTGAK